ncbi:MAG: Stp1/IreP family PP2C-type Ser/Thr phosphatase [Turicibacter sp.]|nr:Stp1/IreP family PP2C-type Ser/Thr phosphatase [Turicibacter sp.]MDO5792915.1 Stp1/IreP family PP2C-type Ser/Thr phosphatase [Turicibacter sp.]
MFDQMCYKTDVGKIRPHNEDAVKIYKNPNCSIIVIADGMGGHEAGEVASAMVLKTIEQHFNEDLIFDDSEVLRKWLKQILHQVNENILTYIEDHHISHGMGTTAIVAVMTKSFIAFAHIGDSRAYLLSHRQLRQITKDHTFVRKLVEEGKLSEQEAKNHPHRNIIMNALGVNKSLKFDYLVLEHYQLDAILLCTDGLTSMVDDQEILAILSEKISTEEKVNLLIEVANRNGGNDNISVALCESLEGSDFL